MAIAAIPQSAILQQGNGQVLLAWDLVSGATSYSVQRSSDGVTYSVVGTPSINSFLDTTVTINTLYYYQVASVNGSGTSGYTNPQNIIPTLTGQISLGELRQRSQQKSDLVNSQFITTNEWNFYINESAKELYDLLITVYEDYYVAPRLLITTITNQQFYDLPDGQNYSGAPALYKLYGVDLGLNSSNNAFVSLQKFDFIQRNRYVFPQITSSLLGVFNLEYRLVGSKIMFIPGPTQGQPFGLWYYPRLKTLLQDTDILDGISGWELYVICRAAKYALDKEESDTSRITEEISYLKQRIESSAMNRDAGQPDTISDVRTSAERWGGWGGGPTGGTNGI